MEEEIPDSLGEMFAFYNTYQPKCFAGVVPYNDLSIICSDALIAKDENLCKNVLEIVKNIVYENTSIKVKHIKEFYKKFMDSLKEEKRASIDLSTLVISAARKDYIDFSVAYDSIIGDQIYQAREKRKSWPVLTQIMNYILRKPDDSNARKKAAYEVCHHILTPERRAKLMKKAEKYESEYGKSELSDAVKKVAQGIDEPEEDDESESSNYDPLKDFYKSLGSQDSE